MLRPCIPQDTLKKLSYIFTNHILLGHTEGTWSSSALRWSWLRGRGQGSTFPCSSSPGRPAAATPAATHMAEDHGLSNGDGPVEVTQGLELLVSVIAQHVILLDGVQRLLLTLQFDNVWVWDHFLGKFPYRVFEGGREKQHLAVPGQHPAKEGPGIWHDCEFFTATNRSTASPSLDGLHPQEGVRGGGALWGRGRSTHGRGRGGGRFPKSFSSVQAGSTVSADMAHQTHASEDSKVKNPAGERRGIE